MRTGRRGGTRDGRAGRISGGITLAVFLLAAAGGGPGCGYRLAGHGSFLPEGIRTIGVPPFESMVPRSELVTELTRAVTEEFIARGGYRIVPSPAGADAVLDGTITGLVETPVAFDQDGRATRSQLVISARVRMVEVKGGKALYENPGFQFRTDLDLGTGEEEFLDPESEGIQVIASEFAKTLVATIVEGF